MATGRLAGTGLKLKGKLTLEIDREIDPSFLASLLQGNSSTSSFTPAQTPSSSLESLLPLFPQSYLSNGQQVKGGSRKFNYRSPDIYPTSAGMVNKGEATTLY